MNTSPQQAQRYVLISVIGLLVIAAYRGKLTGGDIPLAKRLWGTGVLAIMLGLIADVAPQIAGPFSILILVGSVTKGGDKALGNLLGKASGRNATTQRGQAPPGPLGPTTTSTGTHRNQKPAGARGPTAGG